MSDKPRYNQNVLADTEKCIQTAISATKTARDKVQIACVSVVFTGLKHRDTRKLKEFANTLIDGTSGLNQRGLVEWFTRQGGIVSDDETGFSSWNADKMDLDSAKSTMWYDLKPQNPYQGFSLEQALRGALDSGRKAVERANRKPEDADKISVPDELVAGVQELLRNYVSDVAH